METDRCIQVGDLNGKGWDCINRVYSVEGICPTINTSQGGWRMPMIEVTEDE